MNGNWSWIALAFAGTAVILALDPLAPANPVAVGARVERWVTDPAPVRQPRPNPEYVVAGYTFTCSDCHRIIASPPETQRELSQHREIQLQHGLNARCFNCHDRAQRDAFVDDRGALIPWGEPERLCAKCHGPVYRDWEHGSHGRINGYWNTAMGPQTRRKCTECHDPHRPPFAPMPPAPAPHTLRMGTPTAPVHEGRPDPLRIYSRHAPANPDP